MHINYKKGLSETVKCNKTVTKRRHYNETGKNKTGKWII